MTLSLSVQSARFANRLAGLLFAGLLMAASLHAQQDRQLVQNGSQTPSNGKRLALVIGNGAYTVIGQMAAERLGVPLSSVKVELGDSSLPPAPVAGETV